MKDKQMACIILGFLIVVAAFGLQKVHGKLKMLQMEVATAKDEAEAAEFQRESTEKALRILKADTAGLRDFFDKWMPYLGSASN